MKTIVIADYAGLHGNKLKVQLSESFKEPLEIIVVSKAEDLCALLVEKKPYLLIMEFHLPDADVITCITDLGSDQPDVIFLGYHDATDERVRKILQAGFMYCHKDYQDSTVVDAVRNSLANARNKSKVLRWQLLGKLRQPGVDSLTCGLAVPAGDVVTLISIDDIIRLEPDNTASVAITLFYLKDGEETFATKPFAYFEEILHPIGFTYPNSMMLINPGAIRQTEERVELLLTDGTRIRTNWKKEKA